ncbi:MAG: serine hydrolase domain-containing protein [Niabella sp.]
MTSCPRQLINNLIILLCTGTWFNTGFAQEKNESLRHIAEKAGIPGMQIIHQKKEQVQQFVYGVKHSKGNDSINATTVFQAASLTKVVATYVFLRMMDRGLIELDKPLWDYYPYDRLQHTPNKERITARMVLTHRSGLLNWESNVSTDAWRASPLTLQFYPGTAYMYSGEGFYFLQETLEHLAKKSFRELVEEEVLQPFKMSHSAIAWKDELEKNIAFGHYDMTKPRSLGRYRKVNAAYTLYTTADDYNKFVQKALLNGQGLSTTAHQLLLTRQADARKASTPSAEDAFVPCALGLRLQLNEVGTALWHTGSNPGFRCFFMAYPQTKESLVVFMNSDTGFAAMGELLALFLNKSQTFWAYDWRRGELD